MATPCSVNAIRAYRMPPQLEVTICNLKLCSPFLAISNIKSSWKRFKFLRTACLKLWFQLHKVLLNLYQALLSVLLKNIFCFELFHREVWIHFSFLVLDELFFRMELNMNLRRQIGASSFLISSISGIDTDLIISPTSKVHCILSR